MVELTVSGLEKKYGRRTVFRDLELRCAGGEIAIVTGPNGSGKSTLLRTLAGLERPDAGTVHWSEHGRTWERAERRRRIGFLSPDLTFYRELTAVENLRFFARLRGRPVAVAEIDTRLEEVGLGTRAGDRVAEYSTGMVQRLRLAFARLGSPPALLLDEPGQNLDRAGTALALELIAVARSEGCGIVVATTVETERELGDVEVRLG